MPNSIRLFQVDAFTRKAFTGNPAAVCLLESNISDDDMKRIAAEMNLSETAFVKPVETGDQDPFATSSTFNLRWFTPTVEVPLCGHATLASAGVLFEICKNPNEILYFQTLSGTLTAQRTSDGLVALELPTAEVVAIEASQVPTLVPNWLEVVKAVVGDLPLHSVNFVPARKKIVARLEDHDSRKRLESIIPNLSQMLSLHNGSVFTSVTVTAKADEAYDFVSRHFSPWIGINEDPVTGSAHAYLTTYWAKQLQKDSFVARQCSARGGDLYLQLTDEGR
eukprot:Colp12_sorted_trinity150504_noHs@9929